MRTLAKTSCLSLSLIFTLTGAASLHAQVKILTDYKRLTIADGLSNNSIHCIFQDSRGFLWIGTANGLNRYDGYDFTVFKHEPYDSTSIAFSWINAIYEDGGKRLWIGTAIGLSRFDPDTETFTNYKHDPNDPNSLSGNEITALHEDSHGNIWIGVRAIHHHWGLNKLDTTGKFIRYKLDQNETSLPANWVTFITEDLYGQLWIGMELGGLKKFDPATEQITHYMHDSKSGKSKPSPAQTPLRTGRDSFPSYGSSTSKVSPFRGDTQQLHFGVAFAIRICSRSTFTLTSCQGIASHSEGPLRS